MKKNTVYIYKNTDTYNNYKAVILNVKDSMFHSASFKNIKQFERFIKQFGLKLKYITTYNKGKDKEVKVYELNYTLMTHFTGGFWNLTEIPKNAIKIKALSNGRIVDCYYKKDKKAKQIVLYRPNPNAKDIYKPLDIEEHIAFQKLYGIY